MRTECPKTLHHVSSFSRALFEQYRPQGAAVVVGRCRRALDGVRVEPEREQRHEPYSTLPELLISQLLNV